MSSPSSRVQAKEEAETPLVRGSAVEGTLKDETVNRSSAMVVEALTILSKTALTHKGRARAKAEMVAHLWASSASEVVPLKKLVMALLPHGQATTSSLRHHRRPMPPSEMDSNLRIHGSMAMANRTHGGPLLLPLLQLLPQDQLPLSNSSQLGETTLPLRTTLLGGASCSGPHHRSSQHIFHHHRSLIHKPDQ